MSKKREKALRTNKNRKPYLVDVMSRRQKLIFGLLVLLWAVSLGVFAQWWFKSNHVVDLSRFLLNSLILSWSILLPGYFFFFVAKMKRFNPKISPPKLKVAMVVAKAPSEPFSVIKKTLQGMLAQEYPHDTWLADEDPDLRTREWCERRGVRISTRKNIPEYNCESWPRRTKCKEGNLAYFYDHYGYKNYEVVVQLDADHVPADGYLTEMVRPFADPEVGYVSAPSVCDANSGRSWAARARLYAEASMHGVLQAGYNDGWAPLCIGSHYAVRTKALKEIGGIGPELAEDHSTTLMMNAHGWRGVHAFDAEAHGDGPNTFADCMTQEFQWSKSLVIVLLKWLPKYIKGLDWKLKLQFVFSEIWYPLFGGVMFLAYTLPIIALLSGTPWVKISYATFMFHFWLLAISGLFIVLWLKSNEWFRSKNSKIISWEMFLFQLLRWPWVLLGSFSAIITVMKKEEFNFKVTPKGQGADAVLPIRTIIPYVILILLNVLVSLLVNRQGAVQGYYYFTIFNAGVYLAVVMFIVFRHLYEAARG